MISNVENHLRWHELLLGDEGNVLAYNLVLLLLLLLHLVTLGEAQFAHVTHVTETEVVVGALLADPVTSSFLVKVTSELVDSVVQTVLVSFVLAVGARFAQFLLLGNSVDHVVWLSLNVLGGLGLLASVAGFSSLEIVVLAFGALPTTVWELKVGSLASSVLFLAGVEGQLGIVLRSLGVEGLLLAFLADFSKICHRKWREGAVVRAVQRIRKFGID